MRVRTISVAAENLPISLFTSFILSDLHLRHPLFRPISSTCDVPIAARLRADHGDKACPSWPRCKIQTQTDKQSAPVSSVLRNPRVENFISMCSAFLMGTANFDGHSSVKDPLQRYRDL